MNRNVYVYKLEIAYPEGSGVPGWKPQLDPEFLKTLSVIQRWRLSREKFRWPRERMFLSSSSAWNRAWVLQVWGCKVTVLRSAPVTFQPATKTEYTGIAQNW